MTVREAEMSRKILPAYYLDITFDAPWLSFSTPTCKHFADSINSQAHEGILSENVAPPDIRLSTRICARPDPDRDPGAAIERHTIGDIPDAHNADPLRPQ